MGDVVAAVDRYTDIPEATRARLKARMAKRDYDEMVSIGRDEIAGKAQYNSEIRQMYFGGNNVCNTVTRAKWTPTMQERGLVYCEGTQCILVPTVCRNVSRITRVAPAAVAAAAPPAAAPSAEAQASPQSQLDLDPTGAGNPPGEAGAPANPAAPGSFAQAAGRGLDGGLPAGALSKGPSFGGGKPIGPNLSAAGVPFLPPAVVPGVPEPETWAMLLLGLLTVGIAARRRKARA
jgi:hypothetical protein